MSPPLLALEPSCLCPTDAINLPNAWGVWGLPTYGVSRESCATALLTR